MGRLRAKSDYEDLRNARILENQARLASLGLHKTISELRSITSWEKSVKTHVRKCCRVDYSSSPLRRSNRLKGLSAKSKSEDTSLRRSSRLLGTSGNSKPPPKGKRGLFEEEEECLFSGSEEKRPANAPLVRLDGKKRRLSPDVAARRCRSKEGRGCVYDPIFGICCHFCRQKTLCSEEDCNRCSNLETDQPCIGKTDCSVCHSSNGVLCRACLKVRYGEEMEEVRENKQWMCPHCIEEKGINPYWICNSSFCLKQRKMAPTGLAIYRARMMGYKSVAHLLMDELQRAEKCI
ncbi:hypothetical protein F0562_025358 [Nyssa sinensis]|uniref:Zinc-finger domain-containing protein n=1 Tax=Nyssa sinensis TaxID=561372 RepID=A0A5J5BDZ8_9ASTE|nr:hypothetical protein F0562_025358 [Nyssa sinensis]